MAFRVGSANFTKGEVSEELVARFDVGSYHTALRKASNVITPTARLSPSSAQPR